MNILVINGSPKGEDSNTMRLTRAFLNGIGTANIKYINICNLKIAPCKGCFACWNTTPGQCVIEDDAKKIIEDQLWADCIIWSFPLYYFNVPGILKNMIDRQLPMVLPFMSEKTDGIGSGSHPSRYDMSGKRYMLISTCGFYSAENNYESVISMFDRFLGNGKYDYIFCGQGELFRIPELRYRTETYLETVKRAGGEFFAGAISDLTKKKLNELLYPKDIFEKMADASWGIEKESGEKADPSYTFTKQMAALYQKKSYDKDRVLEMHYTDLDKTYQILLGRDGSKVFTDGRLTATTSIDTPFEVWQSVARGELDGSEALGKQLYTVRGDFSLMINWNNFFRDISGKNIHTKSEKQADMIKKSPSMYSMLIPWIVFWAAVSIRTETGAVATLTVAAMLPFIMKKYMLVLWDHISIVVVSALSVLAYLTKNGTFATNAGYLIYSSFWLISCFTKEPLSAAYVQYNYGGEKALRNPIFMKTNYILSAAWGILYLFTAIWTFFLRIFGFGSWIIFINNLVPIAMGIFTVWFAKWYPAWKASGKGKRI